MSTEMSVWIGWNFRVCSVWIYERKYKKKKLCAEKENILIYSILDLIYISIGKDKMVDALLTHGVNKDQRGGMQNGFRQSALDVAAKYSK